MGVEVDHPLHSRLQLRPRLGDHPPAVRMADQRRVDDVVAVEHGDDIGDMIAKRHVRSCLVAPAAETGEGDHVDGASGGFEQLDNGLPAPLADPGAVDEDDRCAGTGGGGYWSLPRIHRGR